MKRRAVSRSKLSRSSLAAFGQGAVYAAKRLMDKDKGIYTMEEAVALNSVDNPVCLKLMSNLLPGSL